MQPAKRTDYQLYTSGSSSRGEGGGLEPADMPAPILQNEAALELLQESIKRVRAQVVLVVKNLQCSSQHCL